MKTQQKTDVTTISRAHWVYAKLLEVVTFCIIHEGTAQKLISAHI